MFTNRTHLHRYVFDRAADEIIPVIGVANILAVDYDYANDCIFWSDIGQFNIQVVSPFGKQSLNRGRDISCHVEKNTLTSFDVAQPNICKV